MAHSGPAQTIIYVSDAEGFINSDKMSKQTMIISQQMMESKNYSHSIGMMSPIWKQGIYHTKIAVLIHGYNNEHEDEEGKEFCDKIIKNTQGLYDTYICYFWPGGDTFLDYSAARKRVTGDTLPKRLARLILQLTKNGRDVDIIAHSMGCRLTLEMMEELLPGVFSNFSLYDGQSLRNVFLLAPAVHDNALLMGGNYHQAPEKCHHMHVFFSKDDDVLEHGYSRKEDKPALGFKGSVGGQPHQQNVMEYDCTSHKIGHSDYVNSKAVFQTIRDIVEGKRLFQTGCKRVTLPFPVGGPSR